MQADNVTDSWTSGSFLLAPGKLPRLLNMKVRLTRGRGTVSWICNVVLIEAYRDSGLVATTVSIDKQVYTRNMIQALYMAKQTGNAEMMEWILGDMRDFLRVNNGWLDALSVRLLRILIDKECNM
jgi:hypothetical protein